MDKGEGIKEGRKVRLSKFLFLSISPFIRYPLFANVES
jgi:hypothetical protein